MTAENLKSTVAYCFLGEVNQGSYLVVVQGKEEDEMYTGQDTHKKFKMLYPMHNLFFVYLRC